MRDDPSVIALVTRAARGDRSAWDEIVERYAALVWSICSGYRLSRADIDDIGQTVWLRLIERLDTLREPAALPGWLATTTHRECLRVLREARRLVQISHSAEAEFATEPQETTIEQQVIIAERDIALRAAFAELPPRCRQLLTLLMSDPHSYAEISDILQMPVGSIGPQRSRCLDRLRQSPHLTALGDISRSDTGGDSNA